MMDQLLQEAEVVQIAEEETNLGLVTRIITQQIENKSFSREKHQLGTHIVIADDQLWIKIDTLINKIKGDGDRLSRKEIGEI